jgi:hypothetical protein
MAVNRLPPDFREFLKLLHGARVKYLLVGGYAVGYYGYPHAQNFVTAFRQATGQTPGAHRRRS